MTSFEPQVDAVGDTEAAHPTPIRVLIADDQPEVCSALTLIIEQLVGYRVIADVDCADCVVAKTAELAPDVLLIDWELDGAEGGWRPILEAVRASCPGVGVIALSGRTRAEAESLALGVDAFVGKLAPPSTLLRALDDVWAHSHRSRGCDPCD